MKAGRAWVRDWLLPKQHISCMVGVGNALLARQRVNRKYSQAQFSNTLQYSNIVEEKAFTKYEKAKSVKYHKILKRVLRDQAKRFVYSSDFF